jgi:hypothetical protein
MRKGCRMHDTGVVRGTLHPAPCTLMFHHEDQEEKRTKDTKKRMGSVLNLQDYFPKRDTLHLLKVEH